MTSKCTTSAPARRTDSTSSPSFAKLAERMEGAIQAGCMRRLSAREAGERFAVFFAQARDDVRRQLRAGCFLVPVERFEIVAQELLVEARWTHAGAIGVGRPEAR